MTKYEATQYLQAALNTLTAIDTLTRHRTGARFTMADIYGGKKHLRIVLQLIEAGAHDVAFDEETTE